MKHFRTALRYIRRSPYLAATAIILTGLIFFEITFFTTIIFGSQKILSHFELKPQVTAFLKDEATPQETEALKQTLGESGKVASIRFVSKDEALTIYREQNKGDPLLLEMVTANILPASFEVSATTPEYLPAIYEILKTNPAVGEVLFQKDIVDSLLGWTRTIRIAGLGIICFSAAISVLAMVLLMGMKISARKEEIEIISLLGADSGYIRAPFIFESIIYALLGVFPAYFFTLGLIYFAFPSLSMVFSGIDISIGFPVFMIKVLGMEIITAVLVGGFAGFVAVKRYLKV
ncbi:MAG: permease-like cell division protein FtsX [bacterium]|nr:permease-like cell division protein FtsX [bacterium]